MMQKQSVSNSPSVQKRLEKASKYVNDLWFPVNSELLAKIKLGIQGGVYDLDPEALVSSVSADLSLFTYCLRELVKMLRDEGVAVPLANPVEILRQAGYDRLKQILQVEENRISKHSLENCNQSHVLRMEEMLISASTSQVLAERFRIDKEIGYSASVLRQLGHTLIAWNYPGVYQEALNQISADKSLDELLADKLGFSPALLSIRVLMDWGLPLQLCEAIFLEEDDNELEELDADVQGVIGGALAKICSIGETLARANNPAIYPSAARDWEYARAKVESYIGEQGMQVIQEAFQENLENYITFLPEIFHAGIVLDPDLRALQNRETAGDHRNPFIILCSKELAAELGDLYQTLVPGYVSEEGLNRLVNQIIPASGFSGGLIYTVDPALSMLLAQTVIGTPRLKSKKHVDYSLVTSNADSVALAFRAPQPVIEFRTCSDKKLYTGMSGILGYAHRVGVLYLEIPYNLYIDREQEFSAAFKAYCKTISDCLDLS